MTPAALFPWLADPHRPTLLMGILNLTPDSFSDGGKFTARDAAIARAEQMVAEGADWIDIGAESTRPGSGSVPSDEQIARLMPALPEIRRRCPVVLSIDTTHAAVAEAALDAGVDVANDISAGRDSPEMLPLVARKKVPIILMHMQGKPATMQIAPSYRNVTVEVRGFLQERIQAAQLIGIDRHNILIDPGIGFGKTTQHNLQLLRDLPAIADLGQPVVVGTSRKGFIERITGEDADSGRLVGTAATVAWSVANGAAVVRVHDVKAMKGVVRMIQSIRSSNQ